MPLRNLLLIFGSAIVSLMCYHEASRNHYADIVSETMDIIEDQYFEEVDRRELFENAMRGMVELDPHSTYFGPEDFKQLEENLDQQFGGVGIQVEYDEEEERLRIVSPLPDTPAHRAGIQAGDLIEKIDDTDASGMQLEDAVDLIKGEPGTPVVLSVRRQGREQLLPISMQREQIHNESVAGDLRHSDGSWDFFLESEPNIGYVRLRTFGEKSTEELRRALDFKKHPVDALVLDLRDNAGGLLDVAVDVCDMFIDKGSIVSTRGRGKKLKSEFNASSGNTIVDRDLPMVVLINGYSASASEIVAACLQDHKRAVVVGERSWGKGTVQNIIRLENGKSAIKLTTASYWRPSGKNIHRHQDDEDDDDWGVRPNEGFEVELSDEEKNELLAYTRDRGVMRVKDGKPDEEPADDGADDASVDSPDQNGPFVDRQLKRAVDYLKQQISRPKRRRA